MADAIVTVSTLAFPLLMIAIAVFVAFRVHKYRKMKDGWAIASQIVVGYISQLGLLVVMNLIIWPQASIWTQPMLATMFALGIVGFVYTPAWLIALLDWSPPRDDVV